MTQQTETYQPRHRLPDPAEGIPAGATAEDQAAWTSQDQPGQDPPPNPGQGQATSSTSDGRGGKGSIRASSLERMSREGLTDAAEHAFRGAGEALNAVCAEERGLDEEPDDIWIPTDDEAEGVAEPTGRLLSRRLPEVPGGDANDAADLVALAIPLGIWAFKGLTALLPRLFAARRRKAVIAGQVVDPAAGGTEARQ